MVNDIAPETQTIRVWRKAPSKAKYTLCTLTDHRYEGWWFKGSTGHGYTMHDDGVRDLLARHEELGNRIEQL